MVYKLFLLKLFIVPSNPYCSFQPIVESSSITLIKENRIRFYFTCYNVKPYLEYINTIVKLQQRSARLILDADFSTSSAILFQASKWISFSDIVKFHQQLSLVCKCINRLAPFYLQDMFHQKYNSHTYMC